MEPTAPFDLVRSLDGWLAQLRHTRRFRPEDLEELRSHLLDAVDDWTAQGWSLEAAFVKATAQLGTPAEWGYAYRPASRWYAWRQRASGAGRWVLTSKKVAAFSLLFVALTFGSMFGQKPAAHRRPKPRPAASVPAIAPPDSAAHSNRFGHGTP